MKKVLFLIFTTVLLSLVLVACSSQKAEYNYITAKEVKQKIENNEAMFLVDIQVEDEFDQHHIVGAIPTYAYPTETDEDRAKLATLVDELKTSNDPVVIICPAGGGGATRTYDYYLDQGISADRLLILEKGQKGWSYEELLAN